MAKKDNLQDIGLIIQNITNDKLSKSLDVALATEEMLERLISRDIWTTAQELMDLIKARISKVDELMPLEHVPKNIMRHVIKVIRDEYLSGFGKKGEEQSLHQYVKGTGAHHDFSKPLEGLRTKLLDHLTEYKVELQASTDNIANQAVQHIHNNEVIMTKGKSTHVEKFLKSAGKERKFQVIVVEGSPPDHAHAMVAALADCDNIQTTLVPNTHVYALMCRVNKVIISTRAMMADGALLARCGVAPMAGIAKTFSVPVLVLSPLFKLTPHHMKYEDISYLKYSGSPAEILPKDEGSSLDGVKVYNPLWDHVTPDSITMFISQQGGNSTSYVYRLLSELYHPDDYEVNKTK